MGQGTDKDLPSITNLYTYPVKGFSPHVLESAVLEVGATMPCDRIYAVENGPGRFDPADPKHLPKINFLMLMRNERVATLETTFSCDDHVFTIMRDGRQVARGALSSPIGRQLIEQFLAGYFTDDLRGAPKIVAAENHSFSDVPVKCVHIVNLASVRELERRVGQPVHPLRFRGNIYVDGAPPWEEFRWVGEKLAIGGGPIVEVISRTERCEATSVDPETGERDLAIPALLARTYDHTDFGVYAKVVEGGKVSVGDIFSLA